MSLAPTLSSRPAPVRPGIGVFTGSGDAERARRATNSQGIPFRLALAACLMLGACSNPRPARANGAASWDAGRAAAYPDQRTSGWMRGMGAIDHGTFCISCHTALPYALA